ncbi:MAG: TRAP transporter small permease subunit [Methyloligellaceae bacterium]
MAADSRAEGTRIPSDLMEPAPGTIVLRCFAWATVAATAVFLLNNYLSYWRDWPGAFAAFRDAQSVPGEAVLAWAQAAFYALGLAVAVAYVLGSRQRALRPDSKIMYAITAYIVRAAFWAVLLIGAADAVISFLRVEGLLEPIFGSDLATELGRSRYRGTWVHIPLAIAGLVIAAFHRRLGFPWLALLVVIAELLIVLTRFIFSYEQAFMGDLVRFWYAALFLFASAHTLLEEGHVRVDVVYHGLADRTKGLVNAAGVILLGMSLCWVVMTFGMGSKSAIINSPLLNFEVTQTGFGMYVKYWMAGFLAIFAVSMQIQFAGYFLDSVADYHGEPGGRDIDPEITH